jgi:glycosyltransferase involved in cell wall biosynthesis
MQALRLHKMLAFSEYRSQIVQEPCEYDDRIVLSDEQQEKFFSEALQKDDIIILHKLKAQNVLNFAKKAQNCGAKIVFFDCDLPINRQIGVLAELVIVTSSHLSDLYQNLGCKNVKVLPDVPEIFKPPTQKNGSSLRCIWFGLYDDVRWSSFIRLKELIRVHFKNSVSLSSMSNNPKADFLWSENSLDLISQFDCVLLPIPNIRKLEMVKSSNKLIQSMALGLPVICSPLPSYTEALSEYPYEIICKSESDWIKNLQRMKDKSYREQLARFNFDYAQLRYGADRYFKTFLKYLKS